MKTRPSEITQNPGTFGERCPRLNDKKDRELKNIAYSPTYPNDVK